MKVYVVKEAATITMRSMRPIHLKPATTWWRVALGATYAEDPIESVCKQLAERAHDYVSDWEREEEVDLFLAFKIAAVMARQMRWPNAFVIPSDRFDLLVPVRKDIWDDGMDALDVIDAIERSVGVALPGSLWESAYTRTFVDVVRFLEAEMARRRQHASE